jgi:hypothetical protein
VVRPVHHTEQEGEPLRKNFSRFLIGGVVLVVLAGGVYLYTAVNRLRLMDPPALTAVAPIAFEQYHHAEDLELMFTQLYRVGSPVKDLRDKLEYSGATLEGKHKHATTITYTYRKPVGTRTWMIWIDADSNGKILNISVDEAKPEDH